MSEKRKLGPLELLAQLTGLRAEIPEAWIREP